MQSFRKSLRFFLFLILLSLSLPTPLFAQEVESSHTVFYKVGEDGNTKVQHEVRLTNLTTSYYVAEYTIVLGFTELKNIEVFDSQGPVETFVTPKDEATEIRLVFNDRVVGKGNTLSFSLTYETEEIAYKNGRIWEINIPRIKDDKDLKDYAVQLSVPTSFGKPAYVKPPSAVASGTQSFNFKKQDVIKGVSIAFGDFQLFDFLLVYHLSNKRLYPIITEIALPPTTSYQEVLIDSLEPAPQAVNQDRNGNWLARYRLEASSKLDVKASGKVKISHVPLEKDELTSEDLPELLSPKKYWESQNQSITEKAKELKTAEAIYDFIVATLTYDYSRIEKNLSRAGAAQAISKPDSAICMEFTDLFVALARSAGIPAREVNGFAFTRNDRLRPLSLIKDVLHAWPEYYDEEKKMWIAIDPTWGNTSGIDYFRTFDFNHFAFSLKGFDSEYPSPAGSYKGEEDIEKKDVAVTFAKNSLFNKVRSLSLTTNIQNTKVAGFPIHGKILIENHGNALFDGGELTLEAEGLSPSSEKLRVSAIPPFGKAVLPITLKGPSYFDNFSSKIRIRVDGEEFSQTIRVVPLYLVYLPWIAGGIGAAVLFLVARKAWSVYLQRRKGEHTLRGQGKQSSKSRFKLPW